MGLWRPRTLGTARAAVLVLVASALLTACFSTTVTFDSSSDAAPLAVVPLTPDGTDRYAVTRTGSSVSITADAANTGGNLRLALWPTDAPATTDAMACTTLTSEVGNAADQEGLVLRLAPTADGLGTRAITVTKNIEFGLWMIFNVHVWDTTQASPYTFLTHFDLSSVVATILFWGNVNPVPYPWHLCARVSGSLLQFMVWTGTNPQPQWTDGSRVNQVTLPPGWVYPGVAGWYVGHLHAGDTVTYDGLQAASLKGAVDPVTTLVPSTSTSVPDTTTSVPDTTSTVPDTTSTVPATTAP